MQSTPPKGVVSIQWARRVSALRDRPSCVSLWASCVSLLAEAEGFDAPASPAFLEPPHDFVWIDLTFPAHVDLGPFHRCDGFCSRCQESVTAATIAAPFNVRKGPFRRSTRRLPCFQLCASGALALLAQWDALPEDDNGRDGKRQPKPPTDQDRKIAAEDCAAAYAPIEGEGASSVVPDREPAQRKSAHEHLTRQVADDLNNELDHQTEHRIQQDRPPQLWTTASDSVEGRRSSRPDRAGSPRPALYAV